MHNLSYILSTLAKNDAGDVVVFSCGNMHAVLELCSYMWNGTSLVSLSRHQKEVLMRETCHLTYEGRCVSFASTHIKSLYTRKIRVISKLTQNLISLTSRIRTT